MRVSNGFVVYEKLLTNYFTFKHYLLCFGYLAYMFTIDNLFVERKFITYA